MITKLTRYQAFTAINKFILDYYCNRPPRDIQVLIQNEWPPKEEKTVESSAWKKWITILPNDHDLTSLEAYNAMRLLLDDYYFNTNYHSDDLGAFLSGLQLFSDGGSWDPAAWDIWSRCVGNTTKKEDK